MRSTRASAAVSRLNTRTGGEQYSMVRTRDNLFYLTQKTAENLSVKLCEAMEMEAFIQFVNAYGPQTPKRISKLDVAFEKQLQKKEI